MTSNATPTRAYATDDDGDRYLKIAVFHGHAVETLDYVKAQKEDGTNTWLSATHAVIVDGKHVTPRIIWNGKAYTVNDVRYPGLGKAVEAVLQAAATRPARKPRAKAAKAAEAAPAPTPAKAARKPRAKAVKAS